MTNFDPILKWYSGKALTVITSYVIPTLKEAEAQGFWPKGASRKVAGALNKQTEAIKFAYAHDRTDNNMKRGKNADGLLAGITDREGPYARMGIGWDFCHAMMFGQVGRAPILVEAAAKFDTSKLTEAERPVWETAVGWARDFAPVAELIKTLDSRRPARKIALGGTLSPTVVANLVTGIKLDIATLRSPPTETKWVTMINPKTKREEQVLVCRILWPKNTVFGSTMYKGSTCYHQCEACGHAIKDPFNWMPLLIDNAEGIPHAFWVGSDCARNLFDAEVEGDCLYEGRE